MRANTVCNDEGCSSSNNILISSINISISGTSTSSSSNSSNWNLQAEP
jgi:hypothetical protein